VLANIEPPNLSDMATERRLVFGPSHRQVDVLKAGAQIAHTGAAISIYRDLASDQNPDQELPSGISWEGRFLGPLHQFNPMDHLGAEDLAIQVPGVALAAAISIHGNAGAFSGLGAAPIRLPEGE